MLHDHQQIIPAPQQSNTVKSSTQGWRWNLYQAGMILAVAIPALFVITSTMPMERLPDTEHAAQVLETITRYAHQASQSGKEILFISNRHLLTFHYLNDVPLIPEYERMFLMEMAMARNYPYLDQFVRDLMNHRFALIFSEPLYTQKKDQSEIFGEENNAWVRRVSKYILCYYKPVFTDQGARIQILEPNPNPENCH
jgi:hypothetical protein